MARGHVGTCGVEGLGGMGPLCGVRGLQTDRSWESGSQEAGGEVDAQRTAGACGCCGARCTVEVQSYAAVWEVKRVEDMSQGLELEVWKSWILELCAPVLALHPVPPPRPQPPLNTHPAWSQSHTHPHQAHMRSYHHLSPQEQIVKVMGDYQVMDEFLYNLSTDDFNDK